jgi:hypothetical protein
MQSLHRRPTLAASGRPRSVLRLHEVPPGEDSPPGRPDPLRAERRVTARRTASGWRRAVTVDVGRLWVPWRSRQRPRRLPDAVTSLPQGEEDAGQAPWADRGQAGEEGLRMGPRPGESKPLPGPLPQWRRAGRSDGRGGQVDPALLGACSARGADGLGGVPSPDAGGQGGRSAEGRVRPLAHEVTAHRRGPVGVPGHRDPADWRQGGRGHVSGHLARGRCLSGHTTQTRARHTARQGVSRSSCPAW